MTIIEYKQYKTRVAVTDEETVIEVIPDSIQNNGQSIKLTSNQKELGIIKNL